MIKIREAQKHLIDSALDGWLLCDFARSNEIMYQFLELPKRIFRRRFFYWIPKRGEPVKIVHAIEPNVIDHCPGQKRIYSSWKVLHQELARLLKGQKKVAMEYSKEIAYVSRVNGGTVDLIRTFGVEVVSSAPFLPYFTAVLTPEQAESHMRAGNLLDRIVQDAWKWTLENLQKNITEFDVQQKILSDFKKHHLFTDTAPNVSVNANSADPHYFVDQKTALSIRKGDFILIDMWAKEDQINSVYADITRVGIAAKKPSAKQQEVFAIVHRAQQAATDFIAQRFREGIFPLGYEVDDVARKIITDAGYGPQFTHRTGHNIGLELHGSGAHLDNLESHDVRPILPGTCFSVEPGIYLEGQFGIRLEYDVYVDQKGLVTITGGKQDEIICLF
jgi:Xaa-Pro dipeptidase